MKASSVRLFHLPGFFFLVFALCATLWLGLAPAAAHAPQDAAPSSSLQLETLSSGYAHTCILIGDGSVACWGLNNFGSLNNIPEESFTQISAGLYHTCVLDGEGILKCWGWNEDGQLNNPDIDATYTQVSAGARHTCAIRTDGTLACWGNSAYGISTPPPGTFNQVSGGALHTCAIKSDGTLACWGNNSSHQLDNPEGTFTQVSAGDYHTCAIGSEGTLACWGLPGYGVLENIPDGTFTRVDAGGTFICAIRSNGALVCWGNNSYNQLDNVPTGTFTQLSAGGFHTCAIRTNGTLSCWGHNDNLEAPRLAISPASLPNGAAGAGYNQTLTASGGTTPYTFSLVAGSLPLGLTLSSTGSISGTPTYGGTYTFTVQAADSWDVIALSLEKEYVISLKYRCLVPVIKK